MFFRYLRTVALVLTLSISSVSSARAQHEGDLLVGVDSEGWLALGTNGFYPAHDFAALPPVAGILNGFSSDEPGFDHVAAGGNVGPLDAGAEVWLEVVAIDPALQAIADGPVFLRDPGDDALLGGPTLHTHLIWHINSDDAAFDAAQCVWSATFLLRDEGSTGYAPSESFTMRFTSVEPREEGTAATGDFDESGSLDGQDFAALAACLDGGGPDHLPGPHAPGVTTCAVECLNAFDVDDDRDVDLCDAAAFQQLVP